MKPILAILAIFFATYSHAAETLPLDDALRATYVACIGIDDELSDMKTMAGINTAVTGVGTAAGTGATVTGFVKQSKDKQIEEIEIKLEKLREIERQTPAQDNTDNGDANLFMQEFESSYQTIKQQLADYEAELDKLNRQSKKLGNWRTGLLAGGTATNVAGAIIAGQNKIDTDLQTQINNCIASVDALQNSVMQARISGLDVTEAETILSACREFKYVDISKINTRAQGAMISSVVGATTGLAGTITSAAANTDKTRSDNTDAGRKKEKNLNTAANILSIGTTAASATATIFNATQISAIKQVASVAEKCTGVLR